MFQARLFSYSDAQRFCVNFNHVPVNVRATSSTATIVTAQCARTAELREVIVRSRYDGVVPNAPERCVWRE
jgi:catalase